MIPIALALSSAAAFGVADFLGGLGARRSHHGAVALVSHSLVIVPLLLLALLVPHETLVGRDLLLGAAGGAVGGTGLLGLYYGLSHGRMTVVAPVTAVVSAVLPVAVGFIDGERPGGLQLAGIALALAAIVLITREHEQPPLHDDLAKDDLVLGAEADKDRHAGHQRTSPSVLLIALASGVAFGAYLALINATSARPGFWPLATGRIASASVFLVVMLCAPSWRQGLRLMGRGATRMVGMTAMLDLIGSGTILYALHTNGALLSISAVLASLYPAGTVLLARFALHEHLQPQQTAGLAAAAVAVAFVAVG